MITPAIYDWRTSIIPRDQLVMAGRAAQSGGMTLGGALTSYGVAGGRTVLDMAFNTLKSEANVDASWTYSRVMADAILRIPIRRSVQLVPTADLGGADLLDGVPWAGGQPWATGENWAWSPFAPLAAAALRGAASVSVDMGSLGQVLRIGHVVGFLKDGIPTAHVVMDIAYDGEDVATVTVQPELRRGLDAGDPLLFRPSMLATCQNPDSLAATFSYGRYTQPGGARFVEALL